MLFLKEFLQKVVFFLKSAIDKKIIKNYPVGKELSIEQRRMQITINSGAHRSEFSRAQPYAIFFFFFFFFFFSCPGSILFHLGQLKKIVSQALPHLFLFFSDLDKKKRAHMSKSKFQHFSTK